MKTTTKRSTRKQPRRHQKKTLGRTNVSRTARRIRREYFYRAAELETLLDAKATTEEIAKAQARLAKAQERFAASTKLARRLEVSKAAAMAELNGDDEGEE